ncbi:UDP-forming cellulose synthase catalytic subunit [Chromobacterium paludis]|uniref:UDP-forming cellulose synthase catalytic subunit n=1 Tax=Chromobacterium paludis TaxID=2605945 RepID=UPI001E5D081F|nr:UDP-forming cellulose synthase catalytic subunit [Chromobacterium paludis]
MLSVASWSASAVKWKLLHPDDAGKPWLCLLSLFFVMPEPGWLAWGRRYFPHVDFGRLRAADGIRIPLQLLWLGLFVTPEKQDPWRSLRESWRRLRAAAVAARALHGRGWAWLKGRHPGWFDYERLHRWEESLATKPWWENGVMRLALYLAALSLVAICVTTPFDEVSQAVFSGVLLLIALWVRRVPGQVSTLILMVFSTVVSTRYMWWRITSTLNDDTWMNMTFGLLLLSAELFAWLVLLLGYFQSSWVLQRPVAELPEDESLLPTVDVLIPIYNEPLRVLRPTVMSALRLDWPFDKLRVHVLDDGQREEVREFALRMGANYITREEHKHAKAGNINHALGVTDGEFVAIFDCDHIPTRDFLRCTMGGFLKDGQLALVQTPHHFFSADPFERNLETQGKVPNEGELFYGRVQDGNDLWNATFFCGSCAVLRRTHLMSVGGIATDTVTEDAHTSLKLHRSGYRSAYINKVAAAGLATESLSAHIGQRIRWARGMAQIFRCDNPLFGQGLTWAQRLCYLNAMLHFLNGMPRLIFLLSPLAFLFFHAYTIYAPALGIVLYVLPHMVFSVLSNSRMHSQFRRSFWGEVYETVLACYIIPPTTVALLFPGLGRFNVTAKGGVKEEDYVDWGISRPYLALLLLILAGMGMGIYRLVYGLSYEVGTVIVNLIWAGYNAMLLGVALAVARELRQVRVTHRVRASLPVTLHLPDGKACRCHTLDYSEGGMALQLNSQSKLKLPRDTELDLSLRVDGRSYAFPCRLVFSKGDRLSVRFVDLTLMQQSDLVQCTFGRSDAWQLREVRQQEESPMSSAVDILRFGWHSLRGLLLLVLPWVMRGHLRWGLWQWLASLLPRPPQAVRE